MAREVLAIGNTGEELVSKFNGNFIQTFTDNNAYFYNVESYGAVHDGVTDDTEAIQAAINACVDGGGGTVFLPVGIYIISGALKNGIEFLDPYTEETKTVNYNSQLYIPASWASTRNAPIKILGEAGSWRNGIPIGVVLRSTIAGTGTWPSVICSRGWLHIFGYFNYTDITLENIAIQVNPFIGTTGPSVSGVNFLYASHAICKNVSVGPIITDYTVIGAESERMTWTQSANHSFGIGIGLISDDFGELQGTNSVWGMYYGFLLGEGINANILMAYNNYIGLVKLKSVYGANIQFYVSNWNTYDIAAQPETIYLTAGKSTLHISTATIELWGAGKGPAWNEKEDYILDTNDYLFGEMNYTISQAVSNYLAKSNGGTNFLCRNAYEGSTYHWTTTTRPSSPGYGLTGYNETTNKIESYIVGTGWVDLH